MLFFRNKLRLITNELCVVIELRAIIKLSVINRIQGGTLKPWPEFVEGLFGGVLSRYAKGRGLAVRAALISAAICINLGIV